MTVIQWRQFTFFDQELVASSSEPGEAPQWLKDLEVTASSHGRGHLFYGDASGVVIILNHSMSVVFSFQAHEGRVTHLRHMKFKNQLVSVGEDEHGIPIVKVWNLDKLDRNAKTPGLQRTSKIQYGQKVFPVTAIAVLENMTQVAIGLENGVVIVIRGDISRDRFTKSKIIHEGSEMITGLGFYEDGKRTILYIVTLARILTCDTSGKDVKQTLDEEGGDLDTVILTPQETNQEIVVGRKEAVYFYGLDGRGPCFVIEGHKASLTWVRNYLVVVSREAPPAPSRQSALSDFIDAESRSVLDTAPSETMPGTILTLYDLKNKFIAYTGTFGGVGSRAQAIKSVLSEWGELYVLTEDHRLYKLMEKDMDTKLDILFKKNMYSLAINVVCNAPHAPPSADAPVSSPTMPIGGDYDYGTLVEIYKKYADWLYSKSEYDSAMEQYIQTIGHLEPSYVIRKFLDAQRIHNLTSYLQALHEKGLANADHTTLLLNCYTKLKDVRRLDEFIKTGKELKFDVETAIRVCRQGRYYSHALYLAKKFGENEWYLRIQVEDLKDYAQAVKYVEAMELSESKRSLAKYGYTLVTEMPAEMTQLLLRLCSPRPTDSDSPSAKPEDFIHLYVNQGEWCITFLERILESKWQLSIGGKGKQPAKQVKDGAKAESSPAQAESVEQDNASKKVVCNTLLELYLGGGHVPVDDVSNDEPPASPIAIVDAPTLARWRMNADELLRNPNATYDLNHALILCRTHKFEAGTLYLYQKMSLHKDILQQHMDAGDYASVIATCKEYGDADIGLWTQALAFFAEQGTGLGGPNPQAELLEVLDTIDRKSLLPPLQVIQVLARNPSVTIGMVKDYIIRRVESERKAIEESQNLITSYREETRQMKEQIDEIRTKPVVFQVTKCEICRQPLELPTIHFLCKHSYHQRCLGDADQECPRCAPEHRLIQDLVLSQEANATRHDVFMHKLETADDRFAVIAEWYSKGAFATTRLDE
ncbi:uncharacterized protein EV422DRAFT_511151 [Fimicolochytrium jonesii]|uniref:uncharacterized protein n=1 Tax=Fimicolochytrium jonesii TaxID=1396493 RepID=UPI0022FE87B9|nr:uncharacterized protein EV422DRAFT_511151 [Fimicolochytrium jonesii]KAI8826715.1 hypothetical protein EV422DRAFT_511151 [Fimicolochytrium jonesii]